ncbi:MAG: dihydrolipoyl dehydrogenase [Thermoplasmata archaeon]
MARKVKAVVIGAGPGGYVAAIRLGQLGVETVLVERDRLGGECLNYGCIPSKALITVGGLVHKVQQAERMGVKIKGLEVDVEKLQTWKQGVVDRLVKGIATLTKAVGVEVVFGEATFESRSRLKITSKDAEEWVEPQNAIVATGSEPIPLKGLDWDGKRVLFAKEALELPKLPASMTVIGGGITGLEVGMMYARLGTEVVVVELLDQLLPGVSKDLVKVIERSLKRLGVAFHLKSKATKLKKTKGGLALEVETPKGKETLESEVLLVSAGRRPRLGGLALEKTGVKQDENGFIQVNARMETNVRGLYAIGDVIGVPFLAHKASKEGMVAAEVIAGMPSEADYRAMPAAIFTDPEIATVGLSDAEAKAEGIATQVGKFPFLASGRALTTGEAGGFVKVIAEEDTGLVLGVEIVGPDASDLISEAALAIEMGAVAEDIALTVHPHPTLPESLKEAAEDVEGRAIHLPKRK